MKTKFYLYITVMGLALTSALPLAAQDNTLYEPQPTSNLFDGSSSTPWVSSYNGETFPIELEVNLGILERIYQVVLTQTTQTAYSKCRVKDFAVYTKAAAKDSYSEVADFVGVMPNNTVAQRFALSDTVTAQYVKIEVLSVYGEGTLSAALGEFGISCMKSNADVLSSSFNYQTPWAWSGVTWDDSYPRVLAGISWTNTALLGDLYLGDYSELAAEDVNVSRTKIVVHEGTTGIDDVVAQEDETLEEGDGLYYDLQGRATTRPVRGIYIRNGKKIVVK